MQKVKEELKKIIHSHIFLLGGLTGFYYYQSQKAAKLNLSEFIIPALTGFTSQKIFLYSADFIAQTVISKQKTMHYEKLVPAFEILEKSNETDQKKFLNLYYEKCRESEEYFSEVRKILSISDELLPEAIQKKKQEEEEKEEREENRKKNNILFHLDEIKKKHGSYISKTRIRCEINRKSIFI